MPRLQKVTLLGIVIGFCIMLTPSPTEAQCWHCSPRFGCDGGHNECLAMVIYGYVECDDFGGCCFHYGDSCTWGATVAATGTVVEAIGFDPMRLDVVQLLREGELELSPHSDGDREWAIVRKCDRSVLSYLSTADAQRLAVEALTPHRRSPLSTGGSPLW